MKYIVSFLFFSSSIFSQQFSVLTCDKGEEIYSTFGHSAIRYVDSSKNIDWVYNYGLFDFYDPNFIPKFCMGKLDYMVGKESMYGFMNQYISQHRAVKEQILNLTNTQRDSLLKFLEWNILEDNKFYRYDFLFNNCATKIIDIIEKQCQGVKINCFQEKKPISFRSLIHRYAENTVPLIDWGMDLALGTKTDSIASPRQYCFLPDFVSKSLNLSTNNGEKLIQIEHELLPGSMISSKMGAFSSPVILAFVIFIISLINLFKPNRWTHLLKAFFFILLGIGGLTIGFEWFFTEHTVTKANWNIGWLNPISLIFGFALILKKEVKWLNRIVGLGLIASMVAWLFGIQNFHFASKILILSAFLFTNVHFHNRKKY